MPQDIIRDVEVLTSRGSRSNRLLLFLSGLRLTKLSTNCRSGFGLAVKRAEESALSADTCGSHCQGCRWRRASTAR